MGDSVIHCQKNGRWSEEFPLCFLPNTDCRDPGTPLHGVKFYTNTTLGSVISFNCLAGYTLVGSSSVQCNSDGNWSDILPQCLPIDCGNPGKPLFGRRELNSTTYQSIVNYSCVNSSYQLVGLTTRRCLANGSWSDNLPSCVLVNCGSPELIPLGRVNFSNTTVGSIATYDCHEGHRLAGIAEQTCLHNGTWSGFVPTCVAITECDSPDIPVFGIRLNNNYSVGSVVVYDCIGGYLMIGPTTRTCLANGMWSGTTPVCKSINCGDPGTPTNGTRILEGTVFQSTVQYSCNDGYILIGFSVRECLGNESWSGVTPKCTIIDCGSPEIPNAGVLFYANTTAGSSITYSCIEGYDLVGKADRVCLNNGTWSGKTPACVHA